MGKAIIISDASFASANLGTVTPVQDKPLIGLSINAPSSINANSYQLGVVYNPTDTNQREITWSIQSGTNYASIDTNTGLLTIKDGADNNNVVVKVTSNDNTSIYATKTIAVTKPVVFTPCSAIVFDKNSAINTGIKVNSLYKYVLDFTYIMDESKEGLLSSNYIQVLIGGRTSSSENRRDVQTQHGVSANGKFIFAWGTGDGAETGSTQTADRYILELGQSGFKKTNYGGSSYDYTNSKSAQTFTTNLDLILGAQNNNGSIQYTYGCISKIHDFKVYNDNTMILHLIPGSVNGVPCFKDEISGNIHYNIGTGTLVAE